MIEIAPVDLETQPGMRHPGRRLIAQDGEPGQIEQPDQNMCRGQPAEVGAMLALAKQSHTERQR